MKYHSIKFKLSILYTFALAVLFLTYSIYLYGSLHKALTDDIDDELKAKSSHVRQVLNTFYVSFYQNSGNEAEALKEAINMTIHLDRMNQGKFKALDTDEQWLAYFDRLDLSDDHIYFYNPENQGMIYTDNLTAEKRAILLKEISARGAAREAIFEIKFNNESFRVIQSPFYLNGGLKYIMQIVTSQKTGLALLNERRDTIMMTVPLILLIAVLIGRLFANLLTQPIIKIANEAEKISHKDLNKRLTTIYKDEEILTLVSAFNKMLDRIEQSFKHIAEFNSHVSHELKTPIAIISGECEVALRKAQTTEEYKETLRAISAESQKMLQITESLLLLAKLDYNPQIFTFDEFNLTEFFDEIFLKFKKLAPGHQISLKLPDKEARLKADAIHLRRLFINILNNAVKFTPQGGRIDIIVKIKKENLIVEIKDTGIGISPEYIDKVFEQFFQKSPVSLQHEQGNGLGLSISQAIAKVHGGVIRVKSSVNNGASFTVTLPIIIASIPAARQQPGILNS